jgi:nitrogen-specific signal transduction histidine kinase/ActR/RegA family two-component response regulator
MAETAHGMGGTKKGRTAVRACYGFAVARLCRLLSVPHGRRQSAVLAELRAEIHRREQAEEALRQAQKMEAVGRLAGGIAHDFNNQLTVISSNLELLLRRLPENASGLARHADAALHGVRRAAALTQRLLVFSRQQTPDPEQVDAGQVLSGLLDLLRRTLGETIAIETVSARGLWPVRVDANQLESALLSLAVNARDAMPQGGKLTIETANTVPDETVLARHPDLAAGQYVVIAMRPIGQDTGLGLSMVRGFVKRSGGHVTIDGEPNAETTIRLYLPRHAQRQAPSPVTRDGAADQAHDTAKTVLVVEDDDAVRLAATEALREIGYQVLEAPDAMEAFRLIADRGGIDLLFTDVGLPGGVNGLALADAAHNVNPALKVLFTTGHAAGTGSPPDDACFLAKPFNLQQLEAKVRQVLDEAASDDAVLARTESA